MWFEFVLFATFLWSIGNIIDEYYTDKFVRKPMINMIIFGLIGALFGFISALIFGLKLDFAFALLGVVSGIVYSLGIMLYYHSLKLEEVTRVVPLFFVGPVFTLILATLFFYEIFEMTKYFGILLILLGSFLVSIHVKKHKFEINKALGMMTLAAFFFSMSTIIIKFLTFYYTQFEIFPYFTLGLLLVSESASLFEVEEFSWHIKKFGNRLLKLMILSNLFGFAGIILYFSAIMGGPVSLVSTASAVQPFFVLIIATILGIFYPKALKQKISLPVLITKLTSIFAIFFGVYLIVT